MVSMLAVLFWPVVVFWLFATRKPAQALAATGNDDHAVLQLHQALLAMGS